MQDSHEGAICVGSEGCWVEGHVGQKEHGRGAVSHVLGVGGDLWAAHSTILLSSLLKPKGQESG